MTSILEGYRVLDLSEDAFTLCGRLLGDMGADVIKVECPGGSPTRRMGPFQETAPHLEGSLFWKAYNYNKRGITLDVFAPDGRALFEVLARTAHFVLESFEPGRLAAGGLGYDDLREINPSIILVSITPWGQTGPHAHHKAGELVAMARGGLMYTIGDEDRPPTTISFPQAALNAATDGAMGALLAHYHRGATGQGQHVDISMQESVIWISNGTIAPNWDLLHANRRRSGAVAVSPRTGVVHYSQWQCKDGWITFDIRFASLTGHGLESLFDWVESRGMLPDGVRELGQGRISMDIDSLDPQKYGRLNKAMGDFFMAHTARELLRGAEDRGVMLLPVLTVADVLEHRQFTAREAFTPLVDAELGATLRYPAPWAKMRPPGLSVRRPAPRLGEHNLEVYTGELGMSRAELAALFQAAVI